MDGVFGFISDTTSRRDAATFSPAKSCNSNAPGEGNLRFCKLKTSSGASSGFLNGTFAGRSKTTLLLPAIRRILTSVSPSRFVSEAKTFICGTMCGNFVAPIELNMPTSVFLPVMASVITVSQSNNASGVAEFELSFIRSEDSRHACRVKKILLERRRGRGVYSRI